VAFHTLNDDGYTGFPLSWLHKITGLPRTSEAFFQYPVVSQQCLSIEKNSSY